jgi:hypothetical protein
MILKILFALLLLLAVAAWWFCSPAKREEMPEKPLDQAWWDALSEEWKTILRINQYFQRHQVDFFQVQQEYLNRLNEPDEAPATERNTPLRALHEKQRFLLSYRDLYARVQKTYPDDTADTVDLDALAQLDRIYMVSGPGDLTPLKKLSRLRVLIANYCGLNAGDQTLDLEPLRRLNRLEQLHCVTPALKSLEPLKDLSNLLVLDIGNSAVNTLAPLKNLQKLECLSFGPGVENAAVITRLTRLKVLFMAGCKQIPDLSSLQNLQQLCLIEHEMALVNSDYRLHDIGFLKNLGALEFLDFELTSYKGSLAHLDGLTRLKAVTLPRVPAAEMRAFGQTHPECVVLNAYEW